MTKFLGTTDIDTNFENAQVVILPVPYEGTTSYGKGTKNGPAAILEASTQVELFDEELETETYKCGIYTAKSLNLEGFKGQEVIGLIEKATDEIFAAGKFPFLLGGEHSISTAPVKAALRKYPDLHVVHFDAHADMRDEYEGSKWSHACVMKRIYDMKVPFTSIGIRNLSREEFELIKPIRKNYFFAHEIVKNENWIRDALKTIKGPVFLTIDIDAFDSGVIPDTGTPEPGGLSWFQITGFIRALANEKKIVGADLVELAPRAGFHASDFAAAKLVYRTIGYWLKSKK